MKNKGAQNYTGSRRQLGSEKKQPSVAISLRVLYLRGSEALCPATDHRTSLLPKWLLNLCFAGLLRNQPIFARREPRHHLRHGSPLDGYLRRNSALSPNPAAQFQYKPKNTRFGDGSPLGPLSLP
jgi:hypothetical protein